MDDMKKFPYNGEIMYYFVKDIKWEAVQGTEMASAIMVVFDENKNQKEFFGIRDEKYKVLYAMPNDAGRWYGDYLNKKEIYK